LGNITKDKRQNKIEIEKFVTIFQGRAYGADFCGNYTILNFHPALPFECIIL
jgi:hypothetical protein